MRKAALALSVVALLVGAAQANAGSGKLAQVNVAPTDAADASSAVDRRGEASEVAAPETETVTETAAAPTMPSRKHSKRARGYDEDEAYARAEAAEYARQSRAESYQAKMQQFGLPDCDVVRSYARSFSGY